MTWKFLTSSPPRKHRRWSTNLTTKASILMKVEESSNNKNVNDKSDVFQINTGMFDLKGKNLPPKLAEIKQHFKITDINNEQ